MDAQKENLMPVICKHCSNQLEVKVPDYFVKFVKQKCECGFTEDARITKYICLGFSCLFLSLFGSCVANNHYTYRAVEAVSGQYKVEKVGPERSFPMDPEYNVLKKEKPLDLVNPEPAKKDGVKQK